MASPITASSVEGWHFLRADGRMRDGRGPVVAGKTYRLRKGQQPVLCKRGYHASRSALDALRYAPGALVCRVRLSGVIVEEEGDDKLVSSERTVLAGPVDASRVLREFACDCAERALRIVEERAGRKPDPRSVAAIEVARRHIRGEATDAELRKARSSAASAAASSAAYAAYAIYVAFATSAAAFATSAAAYATYVAVATSAAFAAVAARRAERDWQNAELERRLMALLDGANASERESEA